MEKIWLKSYPPGISPTIHPESYPSVSALLEDSFRKYADKPALENLGVKLTYKEVYVKSMHLAAFLQNKLHLTKGDRIAIMLPNVLQYPITLLAALHLGLIVVNINPMYTERELLFPLKDSGAKAIVVLSNFAEVLMKVESKTGIEHILVTEVGDDFPWLKQVLVNSYIKYVKKVNPKIRSSKVIQYREAQRIGKNEPFHAVTLNPYDIAFLQYTGGTTGTPKGAMLSHRNFIANVLQCIEWIDGVLEEGKEIVITALPLYHIFSLTICCFAFLKLGGLSILITNPRDIKSFIKELKKTPFTVFIGVNTLYHALLQHFEFSNVNFTNLKLAMAGGMAMMQSVADKWKDVTGKPVITGYGLTEASPVVTINPLTLSDFTPSIGLPVPSTEVVILDEEGNEVPVGAPGELCVAGPQVMQGYWNQFEETKEVLSDSGWLRTGDIAVMNEEGYIYLVDRKKDMILVSGFNVYPSEIEEVIAGHPGVAEVAVIGVPNDESGEMVKAYIVKKDKALSEEDIKHFCRQKLTGYKQPKVIEFRSELPKSNVGKVLKRELREN